LPGQQDSFLYLLFSRIHFPSNLSFINYWVHTHFLSTHLPTTHPLLVPTYLPPSSHRPLPACSPLLLRLSGAGAAAAPAPAVEDPARRQTRRPAAPPPRAPSSPTSLSQDLRRRTSLHGGGTGEKRTPSTGGGGELAPGCDLRAMGAVSGCDGSGLRDLAACFVMGMWKRILIIFSSHAHLPHHVGAGLVYTGI
jgi:hypothetical protein